MPSSVACEGYCQAKPVLDSKWEFTCSFVLSFLPGNPRCGWSSCSKSSQVQEQALDALMKASDGVEGGIRGLLGSIATDPSLVENIFPASKHPGLSDIWEDEQVPSGLPRRWCVFAPCFRASL